MFGYGRFHNTRQEYRDHAAAPRVRCFDRVDNISVLLTVNKGRHVVEVTVEVPSGMLLRGEESTTDMYTSIDLVVEKLERQIHKQKTKLAKRFRSGGFKAEIIEESKYRPEPADVGDAYPIVKTKRFSVKPMDVQEAIMQMNLLNHNFFVFRDAQSEEICVVYKRNDGAYGLLESGK